MFGSACVLQVNPSTVKTSKYRPRGRHFEDGVRLAALRAFGAAELKRDKGLSLAKAARRCGSNATYARAALVVLETENVELVNGVLDGRIPLLTAARQHRRSARLIQAFCRADCNQRIAFAKVIGPLVLSAMVIDDAIIDALFAKIGEERVLAWLDHKTTPESMVTPIGATSSAANESFAPAL
jgi:hypothetical protein